MVVCGQARLADQNVVVGCEFSLRKLGIALTTFRFLNGTGEVSTFLLSSSGRSSRGISASLITRATNGENEDECKEKNLHPYYCD